jgi:hypothetical protein
MVGEKRKPKPSDILSKARAAAYETVSHVSVFDALDANGNPLPIQPPKPSQEEIAAQGLTKLAELGVDIESLTYSEDGPPWSAQACVQRVIGALEAQARKAVTDGAKRSQGRANGKQSESIKRDQRVLELTDHHWPEWRDSSRLPIKRLNGMVHVLTRAGIRMSPEALRHVLRKARSSQT